MKKPLIFDTHAHYDDNAFQEDQQELLEQFGDLGIGAVTDPGSTHESLDRIVELTQHYPWIYGALGIHPSECEDMTDEWLMEIEEKMKLPQMVSVGEIGLDYHWEAPQRSRQQYWFRQQLRLAGRLDRPVIIHSRDVAEDTLRILREEGAGEVGGVIHCYSYSPQLAQSFLDLGFYIGVGGVVTFKNGKKLKETVRQIPLERIVLETDSPYMAPEPHRGERNCSLFLRYVVQTIAELKETSAEEVVRQTWQNACRLYRLEHE